MYLREHRKARQLTIDELAALVGVSHALVGHVESGVRELTPNFRFQLAEAYGIDIFDLAKPPAGQSVSH